MPVSKVTMQWRRGEDGTGGIYTFDPKPAITRETPGSRTANIIVPLLDGEIIQNLGLNAREIRLRGVLYNKDSKDWDDMETLRTNLIEGLGTGPGQLHLISSQRHVQYNGQIDPGGIRFEEQTRAGHIHEYDIVIRVPSAEEIDVPLFAVQTIDSDAEIT